MNKILATTDFSAASSNAVRYASELARLFRWELIVVHVFNEESDLREWENHESDEQIDMKNLHLDYIKGRVDINLNNYPIDIKGIVSKGIPADVIEEIADKEDVSVIVMGMKGKGRTRFSMGSTTLKMIGKTRRPLLVIPEDTSFSDVGKMVVASDFGDREEVADFPVLEELMKCFKPQITILNIQKKGSPLTGGFIASKSATYRIWKAYQPKFLILNDKDIDAGINNFLEDNPAEMLVMVSKKKGIFEKLFSKSYTKVMTRQIKIPLLIVYSNY